MTTKNSAPPVQTYELPDAFGIVSVTGRRLARVSTKKLHNNARWFSLDLYRREDGVYFLHRIGESVVYHDPDAVAEKCKKGDEYTLGALVDEVEGGEPCFECRPLPWGAVLSVVDSDPETDIVVRLEQTLFRVIKAETVAELERSLMFVPKDSRTGQPTRSRPAEELLVEAAKVDADVRAYANTPREM